MAKGSPPPFAKKGAGKPNPFAGGKGKAPPFGKKAAPAGPMPPMAGGMPFKKGGKVK